MTQLARDHSAAPRLTAPSQSGVVGIVVIGRNERPRLEPCLRRVHGSGLLVYVDSDSSDGSAALAEELGVRVVRLSDPPLTAARGREAGLAALLAVTPELEFVQFIDGDCELHPGWLERGLAELRAHGECAVVAGRVRERHPDASVYNRLCDLEWDRPVGETDACGGIALWRVAVLRHVGGFDARLIAGEEPELCQRVRSAGWTVRRVAAEMCLHDADLRHFRQWWRRMVRAGHAYAESAALYRGRPERYCRREVRSAVIWGLGLPLLALVAGAMTWGVGLGLLLAYLVLGFRVYVYEQQRGRNPRDARLVAWFEVLGKPAQALGVLRYWLRRVLRREPRLIEYKHVEQIMT